MHARGDPAKGLEMSNDGPDMGFEDALVAIVSDAAASRRAIQILRDELRMAVGFERTTLIAVIGLLERETAGHAER